MSTFNSADIAAFKGGVWVFCEQRQGSMMPTSFELISEGRKLADELGTKLYGILLGHNIEGIAKELGGYGADGVYVCDHPLLEHYTTESSQKVLREQLGAIDRQMEELRLLRSRLSQRCSQLEDANLHKGEPPRLEVLEEQYLLTRPVEAPYSLREISIATKQCFAQAFQEELPIFFQSGVRVPLERILAKRYTEASTAFLPIEKTSRAGNIQRLPGGLCATLYHRGDYLSIGATYERLLAFCREQGLTVASDSYEFCINDYITTGDESEYITQILFFVEREAAV